MVTQEYIKECIGRNDYNSVAAACRQLAKEDPRNAKKYYELSDTYEKYGGMCSSILNSAGNNEEKELLTFALQNKFGVNESPIAKEYTKYLNTTNNGDTIGSVEYTFRGKSNWSEKTSEERYGEFCNKLGYKFGFKGDQDEDTPYIYKNDAGNVVLHVPNSFYKNTQMFAKLNNSLLDMDSTAPLVPGVYYTMFDIDGNKIPSDSLKEDPYLINPPENSVIPQCHKTALEYANKSQELLNTKQSALFAKTAAAELIDYGYICEDQKNVERMAFSGQLKREDANFYLKRIQDYYDGFLKRNGLSNYEVYATGINGATTNFTKATSDDKIEYSKMLAEAMKEGRVSYSSGSSGGRVGTIITISGMSDKDGVEIGGRKGDLRMFVPNLFNEDTEVVANSDPNARAVNEYYEHVMYNHQYTLAEGGTLTNFVNAGVDEDGVSRNGAIYTDAYGNKAFKTEEEVKQMIRDNELIKASYRRLQEEFAEDLSTKDYSEYRDAMEEKAKSYATNLYFYVNGIADSETQSQLLTSNKVNSEIKSIVDTILQNVLINR